MTLLNKFIRQFIILIALALLPAIGLVSAAPERMNELSIYVISPTSGNQILPRTQFIPGTKTNKISASACRGEYKSLSFVIKSKNKGIAQLYLLFSPLLSRDNNQITLDRIDISVVKAWYQAGTAWNGIRANKNRILVPELLLKDDSLIRVDERTKDNFIKLKYPTGSIYKNISSNEFPPVDLRYGILNWPIKDSDDLMPFDIGANENKQIWITVHVPDDALPGTYTGEIRIGSQGVFLDKLDLELRVHSFVLEKPKIEYSIYYRGVLTAGEGTISSDNKDFTQMAVDIKNMVEHGIANPTVYQPYNNSRLLETVLDLRQKSGILDESLYYLGVATHEPDNPTAVERYEKQVRELRRIAYRYGIKHVYIYGIDEALPDLLSKQRKVWKSIQSIGGNIFIAGHTPGHFEMVGDSIDLFIDGQIPDSKEAKKYHAIERRIFSYNQPQVGLENPHIYRKNYGIRIWQKDYDGAMPYAYQHGFGFIWNDFDNAEFRDHCFTYPTVNGVINTIAWEGFREGINDVRYIATLEEHIALGKTSENNTIYNDAIAAESYLASLKVNSHDELDFIRQELIKHILKLAGSAK
jgi:hypothetical protein